MCDAPLDEDTGSAQHNIAVEKDDLVCRKNFLHLYHRQHAAAGIAAFEVVDQDHVRPVSQAFYPGVGLIQSLSC